LNPDRLPDFDRNNPLFLPRSQGGEAADRTSYLISPLMSGGNLGRHLNVLKEQQRTPSPIGCLKLLLQLLEAVEHLCKHNVLHLDLKPDNILLENGELDNHEELVVVLCDFGCHVQFPEGLKQAAKIRFLNAVGNPSYRAPELLFSQKTLLPTDIIDASRSELWSASLIVYEALLGRYPFGNEGVPKPFTLQHLPSLPNTCPPNIVLLFQQLLHPEPSQRPSFNQAITTVEQLLQKLDS
jgi:serine/threonine protein kinase